jgi:RNA polymerase sigma factor (TIGR02999 family)
MSDVTRLLNAAAAGDRQAAADLLPLVYDELRKLAAARMAAEAPGHTLDATALVHEAYLRLVDDQQFEGRGHFFAAAEAMRRVLVESARRKKLPKHGGGRRRIELNEARRIRPLLDALTPRERTVFLLVAAGLANQRIAARLGVGVPTEKLPRGRLMRKLHLASVADLVRWAEAARSLRPNL